MSAIIPMPNMSDPPGLVDTLMAPGISPEDEIETDPEAAPAGLVMRPPPADLAQRDRAVRKDRVEENNSDFSRALRMIVEASNKLEAEAKSREAHTGLLTEILESVNRAEKTGESNYKLVSGQVLALADELRALVAGNRNRDLVDGLEAKIVALSERIGVLETELAKLKGDGSAARSESAPS